MSWRNVSEGLFSYIGPLEKGEYTISTKTSFTRRCMISKSIPEVVSSGSVNVTSIPVSGSTGFNYIFIENCGAPGQYFDSSYSDTYLSNFGVSIVKKDITSINHKRFHHIWS